MMVFGTNPMPTEIHDLGPPIWGAVKKEISFHGILLHCNLAWMWKQHGYRIALGQGSPAKTLLVFQFSQRDGVFSLRWKWKLHIQSHRGGGLYKQNSPYLGPDWSTLMQMRSPNPQCLISLKVNVLIHQNRTTLGQS